MPTTSIFARPAAASSWLTSSRWAAIRITSFFCSPSWWISPATRWRRTAWEGSYGSLPRASQGSALLQRLFLHPGDPQVLDRHRRRRQRQHGLLAGETTLGPQLAGAFGEERHPVRQVVPQVGGDVEPGGGDQLEVRGPGGNADLLHLRQPQAVAAEVHPDRVAARREPALDETEHRQPPLARARGRTAPDRLCRVGDVPTSPPARGGTAAAASHGPSDLRFLPRPAKRGVRRICIHRAGSPDGVDVCRPSVRNSPCWVYRRRRWGASE